MQRLIERVSGLEVRKKTIAACVRVPGVSGTRVQEGRASGRPRPSPGLE